MQTPHLSAGNQEFLVLNIMCRKDTGLFALANAAPCLRCYHCCPMSGVLPKLPHVLGAVPMLPYVLVAVPMLPHVWGATHVWGVTQAAPCLGCYRCCPMSGALPMVCYCCCPMSGALPMMTHVWGATHDDPFLGCYP